MKVLAPPEEYARRARGFVRKGEVCIARQELVLMRRLEASVDVAKSLSILQDMHKIQRSLQNHLAAMERWIALDPAVTVNNVDEANRA